MTYYKLKEWFPSLPIDWEKGMELGQCKIYSPETCAFVPEEVNASFASSKSYRGELPIGVIKRNKHYESYFRGKFLGYDVENTERLFNLYKEAKEKYVKNLADKYEKKLDRRVYNAMYNYKVEITD